jgi:SAM-dependent methyltransferase
MDKHDPEELMQKDEMLKAVELAKSLPEHDPRRKAVEQHAGHLSSSQAYQEYYRTMRGGICPEDQVFRRHEQIKRFAMIRKLILERKHKTVLDLGCLDGWQLLNLASSGVTGVGVDLSPQALAVAFERSAKWGFGLRFIESSIEDFDILGNSPCPVDGFDAVILSEVLEHVLDPLACLKTAARHLAKGGVVYVSVPASPVPHHGKLEDAREHLRVFSEEDLTSFATQAGLSVVVDQHVIQEFDEGQAFTHRMMSFRRMTVTVFCNHVTGGWDPVKKDDLGASEEMVVKVAEAWTRQGCDVVVHQNGASQRTVNGVAYRERSVPPDVRDLLVLFKTTDHSNIKAGAKVFWTTDLPAPGMSASFLPPRVVDDLDAVVCISEYHRQELLKACPWLPPDKVWQHWLGIDQEEINSARAHAKVPGRVLYASSYDRGLGALLEMWPKVRKQVPIAELHVTYGWDFWKRSEAVVSESVAESMRQERARLEKLLLQPGVVDRGRLGRSEFLRELGEATVWAYPCTGGELCCKTALEAQAAGCRPVVVPTMEQDDPADVLARARERPARNAQCSSEWGHPDMGYLGDVP